MATKQTQQAAAQQPRSLADIQDDVSVLLLRNQAKDVERSERLQSQIRAVDRAKVALKAAQDALNLAQANDAATQGIATALQTIEALKAEAKAAYDPNGPKSWMTEEEGGFQFRTKSVTSIADQPALARHLTANNLWVAAGANLTVDPKLVSALMQHAPLPGVAVNIDVSVAIYQPKE